MTKIKLGDYNRLTIVKEVDFGQEYILTEVMKVKFYCLNAMFLKIVNRVMNSKYFFILTKMSA